MLGDCYRTHLFICFVLASAQILSYNTIGRATQNERGKTMDYQTLLDNAASWLFSDLGNGIWIIATIAAIGAARGIGRSLGSCKHTQHVGRRVL